MTDFLIDVIVDPSKATPGMDKVDSRLQRLEKSGKRLQTTLRRALTLVGVVAAARQVGVFADSLTNVQNRIRLVTKDTAQLNAVTKKLFDIAARTRTGFAATATIFSRTALAVKDLGLSLQETLDFTEALNRAIVLSGVKAQEANAGLIQLSQGLASGTLRGDELRSVLEQLPKVADLIADKLGVDRGELRLLGEQGVITTKQIIKAFTGLAAADLTKAFAESVPTMSQGFSVLTTRIIQYIGEADEATKISEKFARVLIAIAENLDTVGKVAIVAGAALAGPFAKAGVLFAAGAVKALTLAIAANPIGAIIVVTLAAAAAIVQFGDSIALSEDGLVSLKDVALATWQFIVDAIRPVVDTITEGFKFAINFVIDAFDTLNLTFADVQNVAKTAVNNIIGFFVGMGRALQSVFNDLGGVFRSVIGEGLIKDLGGAVKSLMGFITDGLKAITEFAGTILSTLGGIADEISTTIDGFDPEDKTFVGTFATIGKNAKDAFVEGFEQDFVGQITEAIAPGLKKIAASAKQISATRRDVTGVTPEGDQGIGEKGVRSDRPSFAFRQTIRLLGEESTALEQTSRKREVLNRLLEVTEKLRKANSAATPEQAEALKAIIGYNLSLEDQATLLEDINGPQDELIRRQENLGKLFEQNKISLQQFNDEMRGLALVQAELNISMGEGSFFDGFNLGIDEMLESVGRFVAEAGEAFGNFFTDAADGFASAIGNAIAFGGSIKEAIGGAARSALAGLLTGLINIGIQFLLNAALGRTLGAAAVAASVAEGAAIATAFAPAAALTSLASFGANAVPAAAGISSTVALSQALALTGFADGGFVSGAGGPRTDSIPAVLSNGEFVVNAKATARFRPQLEAMNSPAGNSEALNSTPSTNNQDTNGQSSSNQSSVRIINVLDPGLVEDFLAGDDGENVIVNIIERNASSVNQILGNNA